MFTLAYIVLNENLNARVLGVSMGIVAAIRGGVGGLHGFACGLLTEPPASDQFSSWYWSWQQSRHLHRFSLYNS